MGRWSAKLEAAVATSMAISMQRERERERGRIREYQIGNVMGFGFQLVERNPIYLGHFESNPIY